MNRQSATPREIGGAQNFECDSAITFEAISFAKRSAAEHARFRDASSSESKVTAKVDRSFVDATWRSERHLSAK